MNKPDLDPIHIVVHAEEKLMSYRQTLQQRAWDAAIKASETADPADLDALVRLHAGVRAIDFALATKPSIYRMIAPI